MNTPAATDLLLQLPACLFVFELTEAGYKVCLLNDIARTDYGQDEASFTSLLEGGPSNLLHPDDQERFSLLLYKAGITGGNFTEMLRLHKANGSYSWTDLRLRATPTAVGGFLYQLLCLDINAQKAATIKLEHTYEELLGLMNNSPGGFLVFDTKNDRQPVLTFVSSGTYKLLQGTEAEIKTAYGKDFYQALHPDDFPSFTRTIETALRNLSKFHITLRLKTISGSYVLMNLLGTAVISEGRRRIYLALNEASEEKKAQQLLKRVLNIFVRQQYDNITLINVQDESMQVLSSSTQESVQFAPPGTHYYPELKRLLTHYCLPTEQEQLWQKLQLPYLVAALEDKPELELYATIRLPETGELRYKKFWLCWLDKKDRQLILVQSDYTQLRQNEITQQANLLSALKAAEQANIAKSVFLSRMSHDIRTPLTAIIGFTKILQDETKTQPQMQQRLEKIGASSQFLLSLINDVLDMSRIESGKYSLLEEEIDLNALFNQVTCIISAQCESKGLHFISQLDANAAKTYLGDKLKLQQVLLNILGNAVKFTPPSGTVTLRAVEKAVTGQTALLCFTVKDTGIGMTPEFLPHLFESFSQEDEHDTSHTGTGLGLAICHNIVALMNGTITVQSEKGHGSEFTIQVQLHTTTQPQTMPAPSKAKTVTGTRPGKYDFSGLHLLLAEDHPLNQEVESYLLKKVGFTVDIAANGKLACERFTAAPEGYYAAVILDIRMPVLNGLETARYIRSLDRKDAQTLPLIAMSADAFEEDMQASINNGINAHLAKPINAEELYQALANFLQA